jgi:hypothetical protein
VDGLRCLLNALAEDKMADREELWAQQLPSGSDVLISLPTPGHMLCALSKMSARQLFWVALDHLFLPPFSVNTLGGCALLCFGRSDRHPRLQFSSTLWTECPNCFSPACHVAPRYEAQDGLLSGPQLGSSDAPAVRLHDPGSPTGPWKTCPPGTLAL